MHSDNITHPLSDRQQKVVDTLKNLGIEFDIHFHPPIPTIEEAINYWKEFDSTHCKNLFFRNHKGNKHYLVLFECMHQMDIHDLEHRLHQGKLTFASEARMDKYLGVKPGSVTPFGLINDQEHHVTVFLDQTLQQAEKLSFHPCINTASLIIKREDLIRFLDYCGNQYIWMEVY